MDGRDARLGQGDAALCCVAPRAHFLTLQHGEDARRALQERARSAGAVRVGWWCLRSRSLPAVDLTRSRAAVHQLWTDGRWRCALTRGTVASRGWTVALTRRRAVTAVATRGYSVTTAAAHDRSRGTTATTALLPSAAHDHDDQERDHHQRQGGAQDQQQRERLSGALELNDGRRGHAARAVRLVVVHDQTHHCLLAGTGQYLVFVRCLELGKGFTRLE